jgi:di/tricarboxylate transporter
LPHRSGAGDHSSAASDISRLFPPGVTDTPDAPAMARKELSSMGRLTRDEWIVAVTFAVMVTGG